MAAQARAEMRMRARIVFRIMLDRGWSVKYVVRALPEGEDLRHGLGPHLAV
jgi:hypothetical protein